VEAVVLVARERFELSSEGPKPSMLVHYTTGLHNAYTRNHRKNLNTNLYISRDEKTLGTNLTPIVVKQTLTLNDLRGKSLAVDANNYLYQFLSLIRTRDGTPLKDSEGNITSHLAGLMFRSTRLIHDFNIDLAFVFDGKPPALKREEIKKRHEQREKALKEWQQALKANDYAKAFSKAVMTSRLTRSMTEDAKKLLTLLGIPYVQAPSEAEAQAAYMATRRDVWAASSKDYDTILFGAPKLVRFLTIHGQEYLPSKGTVRPLKPELITLHQLLSRHGITLPQLIDIAILIGTDFNDGVKGIGSKTALKLIKEYGRIENLPSKFLPKIPPQYKEVRKIYLKPEITSKYNLSYTSLCEEELFHFLCDQRDFAQRRVETAVQRMKEVYGIKKQAKLEKWFSKHM
jgi:flap endonuclease-1